MMPRDTATRVRGPLSSNRHRDIERCANQRNEKISNKISFGIIDKADSSTSDRIIVIADTVRFIQDGACR